MFFRVDIYTWIKDLNTSSSTDKIQGPNFYIDDANICAQEPTKNVYIYKKYENNWSPPVMVFSIALYRDLTKDWHTTVDELLNSLIWRGLFVQRLLESQSSHKKDICPGADHLEIYESINLQPRSQSCLFPFPLL